jgi:hypothetical protein
MHQLELALVPKVYCSKFSYRWANASNTWKQQNGYTACLLWETSGALSEWTYVVTRDGYQWFIMYQIWPGVNSDDYVRVVDESDVVYGTEQEIWPQLYAR